MINCNLSVRDLINITKLDFSHEYDRKINHVCSYDEQYNNAVYFISSKAMKMNPVCFMNQLCVFFIEHGITVSDHAEDAIFVYVQDVRKIMTKILIFVENIIDNSLLYNKEEYNIYNNNIYVHKTSIVIEPSNLSENVYIGPHVFIGENVKIGENTKILSGTKIIRNVEIGENCIIRENSVIGGNGFGIEKDENGNNLRIPHLGGVKIGNFVEIGALNTVCSGTIKATTIGDYVKTDDHIHIAHNDVVESNTIITAGTILSGSVHIGAKSWLGINSSIREGIHIGPNTLIGMATCVNKDVKENITVMGNPCRELSEFIRIQKKLSSLE